MSCGGFSHAAGSGRTRGRTSSPPALDGRPSLARASTPMRLGVVGGVLGALAVAAGAFGAHALRGRLDPAAMGTFETAVRYQLVHALALLFASERAMRQASATARYAAI